jgi:hypothetical protein
MCVWTGVEAPGGHMWPWCSSSATALPAPGGHFRGLLTTCSAAQRSSSPCTLFFFINNIEAYSQRAAMEFFEARAKDTANGHPHHVKNHGYRSYAQLFYTRKQPPPDPRAYDEEWLFHGAIDRPVYLVAKVTSEEDVTSIGTFTELYRKNGFVFYRRDP